MSATVRKYAIPALSALSVTMTAGCGDPIVGDWAGIELIQDGSSYTLPYTDEYTYEGQDYSYTVQWSMYVSSELDGDFTVFYSYGAVAAPNEVEYSYGLAVTETDNKQYDIAIADLELSMACTIDDNLSCDIDDSTTSIVFEKQ